MAEVILLFVGVSVASVGVVGVSVTGVSVVGVSVVGVSFSVASVYVFALLMEFPAGKLSAVLCVHNLLLARWQ